MMRVSPLQISLAAAVTCSLLVAAAILAVRVPPWLGASFVPDKDTHHIVITHVVPGGPLDRALAERNAFSLHAVAGVPLTDIDRIEEPDTLPSYAAIEAFLARQDAVARSLDRDSVRLDLVDA